MLFAAAGPAQAKAKTKAKKKAARQTTYVSARAAGFWNMSLGLEYYVKNPDMQVLPASTAKVMTALVVLEHLPLNATVRISPRVGTVQPSRIGVVAGEEYTVEDLLYASLLKSANDACVALAIEVAGSEEKFVEMMNRRAVEAGAVNTKFANANGLPSIRRQYTTPRDMCMIFKAALKHGFFKVAVNTKTKVIRTKAGRKIYLSSHNKILFSDWKKKIYGKTGYTYAARSCFVGYVMKGEELCIIAVFGCTRRWQDIMHIVTRYGDIRLR